MRQAVDRVRHQGSIEGRREMSAIAFHVMAAMFFIAAFANVLRL
jgi:hypothetical protein